MSPVHARLISAPPLSSPSPSSPPFSPPSPLLSSLLPSPRPSLPPSLQVTRLLPDARGTTCNQRIEHIAGTRFARILRVPFRSPHGIVRSWVSRFDIWPYLEQFTEVGTV